MRNRMKSDQRPVHAALAALVMTVILIAPAAMHNGNSAPSAIILASPGALA